MERLCLVGEFIMAESGSKTTLKELHEILDQASEQVKKWPKWAQDPKYRYMHNR